mmetsp:Transcript_28253/g.81718  ORF Transcript_28253/g.81718 Transcript_28253/m.81718 type:complete len:94 (+) Transcript_28253:489-770(+)
MRLFVGGGQGGCTDDELRRQQKPIWRGRHTLTAQLLIVTYLMLLSATMQRDLLQRRRKSVYTLLVLPVAIVAHNVPTATSRNLLTSLRAANVE